MTNLDINKLLKARELLRADENIEDPVWIGIPGVGVICSDPTKNKLTKKQKASLKKFIADHFSDDGINLEQETTFEEIIKNGK